MLKGSLLILFLVSLSFCSGHDLMEAPASVMNTPLNPASLADLASPSAALNISRLSPAQMRIIGGSPAARYNFPYHALLFITRGNTVYQCNGAIINDRWILTAAVCVVNNPPLTPANVIAGFGYVNLNVFHGGEYRLTVDTLVTHPTYNPTTLLGDIALVRVTQSIFFTDDSRPVAMAFPLQTFPAGDARVTGFGQVAANGGFSQTLNYANVPILAPAPCTTAWGAANFNPNSQICAGSTAAGLDACRGDEGGPLVLYNTLNTNNVVTYVPYLVGITPLRGGCGAANQPGRYTRVSAYRNWIASVAGA